VGQLPQGTPKPKMRCDDIVLAMLKHQLDDGHASMAQAKMLASPWWKLIDGEWSNNTAGVPHASTAARACERLLSIDQPQIAKDDSEKQAWWSLSPAGLEKAEQSLTVLRAAGRTEQSRVNASGIDVVAMVHEAMLQTETQMRSKKNQRRAIEAMNPASSRTADPGGRHA
jgi:hypothetical protein